MAWPCRRVRGHGRSREGRSVPTRRRRQGSRPTRTPRRGRRPDGWFTCGRFVSSKTRGMEFVPTTRDWAETQKGISAPARTRRREKPNVFMETSWYERLRSRGKNGAAGNVGIGVRPLTETLAIEVSPRVNGKHGIPVQLKRHYEGKDIGISVGEAIWHGPRGPENTNVGATEVGSSCGDGGADQASVCIVGSLMSMLPCDACFRSHFINGVVMKPSGMGNRDTPLIRRSGFGVNGRDLAGDTIGRKVDSIKGLWKRGSPCRRNVVGAPFLKPGSRFRRVDDNPHVIKSLMLRTVAHGQHSDGRIEAFWAFPKEKNVSL